jgi:multidrug resistance efflux pump
MSNAELKPEPVTDRNEGGRALPPPAPRVRSRWSRIRIFPVLITLATVAVAALLSWAMWQAYMAAPWTRDGTVRVYIVTMAPEVAGRVVELPVADNQFVHKGDLLMVVDPTNYEIAVHQAEAAVEQAKAVSQNAQAQAVRRAKQTTLSVSIEEKQIFASQALSAAAALQQALANLDQARVTLHRTRIVSPVNGYVTNLQVQLGDYVNIGDKSISLVNSDSFWVDGYFEETQLGRIHEGAPATIKLMGYRSVVRGHVDSVARGIDVANAQSDSAGLASVNPIFTWVRLAQRVPVRIHIDTVPDGVRLAAGMTATVQVEDAPALDNPLALFLDAVSSRLFGREDRGSR